MQPRPAPSRHQRLGHSEFAIKLLAVAALVVGIAYLGWRAAFTLNESALWLAIPLFLAECHGYLTFLLYAFMSWDIRPWKRGEAPEGATVDIFIPTYNESPDILAITVAGALQVHGNPTIYVLDDGRRAWVRDLCNRTGVQYLARPDNQHAKAGNINHALRHTSGEFIVVLDADHVPAPAILEDTLGYFADHSVAAVQGPQEFYNNDSFQHARDGSDWHEQSVFYHVIQPGKNRTNSVFWCGSPSVVRRRALEEIGGVATETVTEDLHTSIRFQRAGWRVVFHDGIIARGIAPEDFNAYITQRLRWAQGAMQVIRRETWRSGLNWEQRVNYFASTTTYFDAFRKLTFLAVIPTILFTGQLPIDAPVIPFLAFWTAWFVLSQGANIALGRGHYRWLTIEMFDLLKMFAFARASLTLLWEGTVRFRVTPKALPGAKNLHPLLVPHVLLIGTYAIAFVVGALRVLGPFAHNNAAAIVAAMAWAAFVMFALSVIAWRTFHHVNRRASHRLPLHLDGHCLDGDLRPAAIQFRDVSLSGAAFTTRRKHYVGETVELMSRHRVIRHRAIVRRVREDHGTYIVGTQATGPWIERIPIAFALASSIFEDAWTPSGPPRPLLSGDSSTAPLAA